MNYCVIFGNPVQHSLSPFIHHHFAADSGIELEYKRVEPPLDDLKSALDEWIDFGIVGANITVPFKEEIMRYCDHLTTEAKRAQAVNTLRIRDGKIEGHNTDGIGLIRDIEERLHYSLENKNILLIGAGGASRGIIQPLLARNPQSVVITNRTHERAQGLANEFEALGNIRPMEWKRIDQPFDLIINATSASLQGVFPPLHSDVISSETVGYDLMYADQPTVFMEYILASGGKSAHDGLGMLIEQAKLGFEFWFNVSPETAALYQKMRS